MKKVTLILMGAAMAALTSCGSQPVVVEKKIYIKPPQPTDAYSFNPVQRDN